MKAWEIWSADIHGNHPAVVVSNQKRVDLRPDVVILSCSTMRPGNERAEDASTVILDKADGLDWKTLCRCDLLYTVPKAELKFRRGEVTAERRRAISQKIIQGMTLSF